MFQNISKNTEEVFDDEVDFATQSKNEKIIGILKQNFSVPNIIIYALAFMMSLLGGQIVQYLQVLHHLVMPLRQRALEQAFLH